jgi:DNA-binding HxlR family transcriptional regulator
MRDSENEDFRQMYATMELFSHRWTLEILTRLDQAPARFGDLLRDVTHHPATLVKALRRLVDHGLIVAPDGRITHFYRLSVRGQRALPGILGALEALRRWSDDPPAEPPKSPSGPPPIDAGSAQPPAPSREPRRDGAPPAERAASTVQRRRRTPAAARAELSAAAARFTRLV